MREGSLPMRCSANWSTTVRTAFECPSRLASPQPTTPASVSILTNNHRGVTRKVSTLLICIDCSLLVDDGDDCVDNLFRGPRNVRSEEHTSELQSRQYLVCRLLLEKKKKK